MLRHFSILTRSSRGQIPEPNTYYQILKHHAVIMLTLASQMENLSSSSLKTIVFINS